jgi:hypothetical protein
MELKNHIKRELKFKCLRNVYTPWALFAKLQAIIIVDLGYLVQRIEVLKNAKTKTKNTS